MPRLPRLSGKDVIKKLERGGYYFVRQRGSHKWFEHESRPPTSVPLHDIIGPGLLRQILRETDYSPEEFIHL
ncbi:type II toxin-antitoxin system HicA family toxin [Candidatus Kaiserbacteria bacterium]|nr:type II toxin-antitoxin system HicA family toxin [Candidatus Kaiserbacteria bacterium]